MSRARMPMQSAMAIPQRRLSVDARELDSDSEDSCDADELAEDRSADTTNDSSTKKDARISATEFKIERRMTIEADNKEHKVRS